MAQRKESGWGKEGRLGGAEKGVDGAEKGEWVAPIRESGCRRVGRGGSAENGSGWRREERVDGAEKGL